MIRVLLTGASSFTGAWFARALAEAGAEVVAAARGHLADYDPVRRRRIAWLGGRVRLVDGCPFGSSRFLDLVRQVRPVDLYAHHGAAVGDHRRPDFAVLAAVAADTLEIEPVLDALAAAGCSTLLHTGTLFEADESRGGASSLRAFSPYGLARTLGWQVVRHAAERRRLTLGKFVVASPFGRLEKPCLAWHLAVRWLRGEVPVLRQPQLVRDHVQIQPLAAAYARFALALPQREAGSTASCPASSPNGSTASPTGSHGRWRHGSAGHAGSAALPRPNRPTSRSSVAVSTFLPIWSRGMTRTPAGTATHGT